MSISETNDFCDCPEEETPFGDSVCRESEEATHHTLGNTPEAPFYMRNYVIKNRTHSRDNSILSAPKSIYEYLNNNVYGHEEYKRAIATLLWKVVHHHHPEGAVLVAGESGSGKTEVFRVLRKIYRNIAVVDGASVVPQGYKGSNTLFGAMQMLDFGDKDNPPIIAIDEFDKLLDRAYSTEGFGGLVGELLKMLEGETINISGDERKPQYVDTGMCSFALLGCFSNVSASAEPGSIGFGNGSAAGAHKSQLTADQIRACMPSELNGRITCIIALKNLEKDDYLHILQDERYSPVYRLSREYGVHMQISPQKCIEISESAYDNNTGVRSMNSEICRILDNELFEDPYTKEIVVN